MSAILQSGIDLRCSLRADNACTIHRASERLIQWPSLTRREAHQGICTIVSTSLPLKISRPARSTAPARSDRQTRTWHLAVLWERTGLLGIVALSAALNIVWLNREAYGNTYYAAAVKSMGTSWPAFFYASFDAGGFVTVDKPPVGLWVQAASVKLFGFSGLSLLLPQAIAGVLSVVLLWWLVRRAYGPAAGLIAGLALAVTPISVVTFRNNTMDGQLILVLLLAVWAGSLAAEQGRLRLLLLCAALVGLGYNV
ncbi:MAG: glycosyltransferase family 39 protein, partial [Chloroflexota bacterium]